jgi:hypothetical protein
VRYRTARADWVLTRLAIRTAYSNMTFDSEQVVWVIVLAGLIGFLAVTGTALHVQALHRLRAAAPVVAVPA